ncbi:MAG: sugar kinase [Armatimonadota bacterium]
MNIEVVTLGEAMLRLMPPNRGRLEDAVQFDACIGGAELGVAVALSSLGVPSAWVSKLPNNALGRMCANRVRQYGVDVSAVVWSDDARMGIYFVEHGAYPRGSSVLYDRRSSAASTLAPDEVDWPTLLNGARVFHTSGITCAISDSCLETVRTAVRSARRAGCIVSFDTNYRATLWPPDSAAACFDEILPHTDIVFTSAADASLVFGMTDTPERVAAELRRRYSCRIVALSVRDTSPQGQPTRRSIIAADDILIGESVEFEVVDPFGAGDAFAAGLLYGLLRTADIRTAQRYGDVLSALKQTVPGEFAAFRPAELDDALSRPTRGIRR